jgi:hypothetical protein
MQKFGLLLDFFGFIMLFWQSAVRPSRSLENGGGHATSPADEEFLMERALKWIPSEAARSFIARRWQTIAFALISIGIFLQLLSCS